MLVLSKMKTTIENKVMAEHGNNHKNKVVTNFGGNLKIMVVSAGGGNPILLRNIT